MICSRFDVVVVPFPFDDLPLRKRRPVVVLSGSRFNTENGHSWIAMITSAKATDWPSDLAIRDLETAGLRVPCVVRLRFQTMPNNLILDRIGELGEIDRRDCQRRLETMLI